MTHDEAVNLEAEFFSTINKPEFQARIENEVPDEVFAEWWLKRLDNDTLWAHELADISNLIYALNLLGDAFVPIYPAKLADMGGVIKEGRENMIKVLERGGYGNGEM